MYRCKRKSDQMIMPILLYGCEVWGYIKFEQIEVFQRNQPRRIPKLRKEVPNLMIYGELGRQEMFFYCLYCLEESVQILEDNIKTFGETFQCFLRLNEAYGQVHMAL